MKRYRIFLLALFSLKYYGIKNSFAFYRAGINCYEREKLEREKEKILLANKPTNKQKISLHFFITFFSGQGPGHVTLP